MATPDFLQDYAKDYAAQAKGAYSVPIDTTKFTGRQFVAGEDPLQTQAINLARSGVGAYQPFLTAAQAAQQKRFENEKAIIIQDLEGRIKNLEIEFARKQDSSAALYDDRLAELQQEKNDMESSIQRELSASKAQVQNLRRQVQQNEQERANEKLKLGGFAGSFGNSQNLFCFVFF